MNKTAVTLKRAVPHIAAALLIIAADRVVKSLTAAYMTLYERTELIPGLLDLTYVENTGAALGIMKGARLFFILLTIVALALIVFLAVRGYVRHPFGSWALTLVTGGAIGNFIDRLLFGSVVDMFEFPFVSFAVFNVSDIFVTVGGAMCCIYFIFLHDRKLGKKDEDDFAAPPGRGSRDQT